MKRLFTVFKQVSSTCLKLITSKKENFVSISPTQINFAKTHFNIIVLAHLNTRTTLLLIIDFFLNKKLKKVLCRVELTLIYQHSKSWASI